MEITLVDIESGDTLIETNQYDEMRFLKNGFLYAEKNDKDRSIADLIDLKNLGVIIQTNKNEYFEFPISHDYPFVKIINFETDITKIVDYEGNIIFTNDLKDSNYIPDLDLVITYDNFNSYLLTSDLDTIINFNEWILGREFDFTMNDIRNNIFGDQILLYVDSSYRLFDSSGNSEKLIGLSFDRYEHPRIEWKRDNLILLSDDVSLNDSSDK